MSQISELIIDESRVKALFDDCVKINRYTDDVKSKWYVFDNQIQTSKEIIYNFYSKRNRWCLLLAEMQSGKSGTFFSIPYIISRNQVLIEKLGINMWDSEINVYLLTGMSDKELINQFETDISSFTGMDIKKNVFHNPEMNKFLQKPVQDWSVDDALIIDRMKKNSLILIDESHFGSDKEQILNKFLKNIIGISPNGDNEPLQEKNIYVVSVSATPMAEFINANNNDSKKKIVIMKNASGYYGISEMFRDNKVFKAFDLKDNRSIDKFIDRVSKFNKTGYVLVRSTEQQKEKIKNRLGEKLTDFSCIDYDQHNKSRILDNMGIDDLLKNKPEKKTLIFLKNLLRAGKRVDTRNVIMVHDTAESQVDTTAQSLLGRCCGYGKNKEIEIFCDLESALKYKNWVESDYDINLIPNKSKNIKGSSDLRIKTKFEPIEIDVVNNTEVLEIMLKRKKSEIDKKKVLLSLKNDFISKIIDDGVIHSTYEFSTFYKVDKNKKNSSYQKHYSEVKGQKIFFGDFKKEKSDIGKTIIAVAFEESEKKLLVSFGEVVENEVILDNKSMYHETNIL